MGKDPSADGTAVIDESQQEIRREIAQTRQELGETVATLAHKADVKAQIKERVDHTKASLGEKRHDLTEKAGHASPQAATSAASSALHRTRENPLGVTAVAAFLIGLMLGRSRRRAR
jgi:ElaB/YqjD/DUF883 family membrane-anchored ribosome-binding protein